MNHSIMNDFDLFSVAKRKTILMSHTKDQLAQLLLELTGYSKEAVEEDDYEYEEDSIPHTEGDHADDCACAGCALPF